MTTTLEKSNPSSKDILDRYNSDIESDDSVSEAADTSTTDGGYVEVSESHDEVKEIEKEAQEDRKKVRCWRLGAMVALLMTAFAVTYASYRFLAAEETQTFEQAVSAL